MLRNEIQNKTGLTRKKSNVYRFIFDSLLALGRLRLCLTMTEGRISKPLLYFQG